MSDEELKEAILECRRKAMNLEATDDPAVYRYEAQRRKDNQDTLAYLTALARKRGLDVDSWPAHG